MATGQSDGGHPYCAKVQVRTIRIMQLSPQDLGGGAERVALDLHQGYLRRGIDATLLVRFNRTRPLGVREVDVYEGTTPWARMLGIADRRLAERSHFSGRDSLRTLLANIAVPQRLWSKWRGLDDFNYPYSRRLLHDGTKGIVHLHNLHGGYFDLSALPSLSRATSVVWTLHDVWPLTGHCAYFIDCDGWQRGCGACPDLKRAPSVTYDNTHENWALKRDIYANSRLHVVTPSEWLMSHVDRSMLKPATRHVIPYGVNLDIFKPADKKAARAELRLPQDEFLCLYMAVSGSAANPYKDYQTVDKAVDLLLAADDGDNLRHICLGGPRQAKGDHLTKKIVAGYISDKRTVARYCQASDVFLHAANADNFPCTVLEAQACGLPAIATAVGGIPEQIEEGVTGYLVPRGDSKAMALRVRSLMANPQDREAMARRAAEWAVRAFGLERQVDRYLGLYSELMGMDSTRD